MQGMNQDFSNDLGRVIVEAVGIAARIDWLQEYV
jgi:hypothetical protein